jgi:hypothetical protein
MRDQGHRDGMASTAPTTVLELDATPAPGPPGRGGHWGVLATRLPNNLRSWVLRQADIDGQTPSGWMRAQLEAIRREEHLPADVREWLVVQAVQCGCPGDPTEALVRLVRHLADRYPNGARLHDAD